MAHKKIFKVSTSIFNKEYIVLVLILFLLPANTFGFPETIRHGYLSCATCHYSPTGSGLLTAYGKTMSQELYNSFKNNKNEIPLEEEPPWWQVGAQFRMMQLLTDTPSIQRARLFPMQTEVMAALSKQKLSIVFSEALWRPIDAENKRLKLYNRNLYGTYQFNDNWILRIGKFKMGYGLGLPDHTVLTQQGLGWSFFHETNNGELMFNTDNVVIVATLISPSRLIVSDNVIKGYAVSFDQLLKSKNKLGFNVGRFWRDGVEEFQQNIHAIVSLTDYSFIQSELGLRQIRDKNKSDPSAFLIRYSFVPDSSLRPYLQFEQGFESFIRKTNANNYYLGTEWFPINYFDLQLYLGLEKQAGDEDKKVVNLQGHFYF